MRDIECVFCQHKFQVERWDVVPCPSCGADYDYDDDGYVKWDFYKPKFDIQYIEPSYVDRIAMTTAVEKAIYMGLGIPSHLITGSPNG